jgi:L-lysine 2,3-aminomutase
MKNRMLHIKTITGGDGLIIRVKDLQTILDELCRGIVKYNTIEMKTRGEEY